MSTAYHANSVSPLRHSLAYLVRQADAFVGFDALIIVEEFFYNLFAQYVLPIVIWKHTWTGAINRGYVGMEWLTFLQFIHATLFIVVNVLYAAYHTKEGFAFSLYELLMMDAQIILRSLTIAVKYSTYNISERRELDHVYLPFSKRSEKLVLVGWVDPSDSLLYTEMERSIARNCPHLAGQNMAFPDNKTRKAVLGQMVETLNSYIDFEVGCSSFHKQCNKTPSSPKTPCSICLSVDKSCDEKLVDDFCSHFDKMRESAEPSPRDMDEHVAVAEHMDIDDDAHTITQSTSVSSTPISEANRVYTLPVKLFLWHAVRESARNTKHMWSWIRKSGVVMAIVLGFYPVFVRAWSHVFDAPVHGAAVACTVIYIYMMWFNTTSTLGFVGVGILDHSRRLCMARILLNYIDTNATIALKMHDEMEHALDEYVGRDGATHASALTALKLKRLDYPRMEMFPSAEDADFYNVLAKKNVEGPSNTVVIPIRSNQTAPAPTTPTPACTCGKPDCPICSTSMIKRSVSHLVRENMLNRHQYVSKREWYEHVLGRSIKHVSVPVFYPQNIIAWSHIRHSAMNVGQSFYRRILVFTTFFGIFVFGSVAYSFVLLAMNSSGVDTLISVIGSALCEAAFGLGVILQIIQGSRTNELSLHQQYQLNHIESLTYEYVVTASTSLPQAIHSRLMRTKKVASSVEQGLALADRIRPSRVMALPANYRLLGSMISITLSGIVAGYTTLARTSA